MPALILPLIDAVAHWPERGALVGLDLGTKTIGVAVSDPDRRLATGGETIQRKAFKVDAARLLAIAGERNALGCVLVRRPRNLGPRRGPARLTHPRLRPQFFQPHRSRHCPVGRAAFDRSGRTRIDRHGHEPRQTRRGDRRTRRDLHPAGSTRSAGQASRNALTSLIVETFMRAPRAIWSAPPRPNYLGRARSPAARANFS